MEQPILYKDIEINGRNFRLKKMNALTASFMLFKLMKILTPIFKNLDLDKLEEKEEEFNLEDINLTELMSSIFDLPEKEFKYIQNNCLQAVEEILPAGATQVLNQYGVFCVMNIEFDVALVMNLTVRSLIFNVSGFFEGIPLASKLRELTTSLQNLKM